MTREEERRHRRALQRLAIALADERAMTQWRLEHPDDVHADLDFQRARKAVMTEKRRLKAEMEAQLIGPSTIDENSNRWLDLLFTSEESSSDQDNSDD